jgi:hypothetical protein
MERRDLLEQVVVRPVAAAPAWLFGSEAVEERA